VGIHLAAVTHMKNHYKSKTKQAFFSISIKRWWKFINLVCKRET